MTIINLGAKSGMLAKDTLRGCLYGGAIGDCIGSIFEGGNGYIGELDGFIWHISDDTQLTLATCESIIENKHVLPEKIAANFLKWFNARRLTGIGSSTLQALQALQVGAHWALAGRQGEYAAGNGAAMRIAPLAFLDCGREVIRDVCRITHKNDEAYTGALAIIQAIRFTVKGGAKTDMIPAIIEVLPDTRVRDKLITLNAQDAGIATVSKTYGNAGYVADSVPLAIYAAVKAENMLTMFQQIIEGGGDTDTICSMAGNIAGSAGLSTLPAQLVAKLKEIKEFSLLEKVANGFAKLVDK